MGGPIGPTFDGYFGSFSAGITSFNARVGDITLISNDVTGALGYTPYDAANPNGFQTASQITAVLAAYAPLASPAFSGTPAVPTAPNGTNTTQAASTAFVQASLTPYAPLISPALTGTPTVPTAAPGTNTTQAASTAFVTNAVVTSTVGVASFNTRTGAVSLSSGDVASALGFTAYNAANPAGYQTSSQVTTSISSATSTLAPKASASFTGNTAMAGTLTVGGDTVVNGAGNALQVPNGIILANAIQTTGAQPTTISGWDYNASGGGAVSGVSANFGVISNFSMLAIAFYAISDARLKSDVSEISPDDGERFVKLARPVTYTKDGSREAGLIAQDQVRAGYGEFVATVAREGMPRLVEADGFVSKADHALSLNYDNYVAHLIAAQKSSLIRIERLEAMVARLIESRPT